MRKSQQHEKGAEARTLSHTPSSAEKDESINVASINCSSSSSIIASNFT